MNKLEKLLVDIIENEVLKDGYYAVSSYALYVNGLEIKSHADSGTYLIFDKGKLLYASQYTDGIVDFLDKKFNESKPTFTAESYATFDWKTGKVKLSDLFIKKN